MVRGAACIFAVSRPIMVQKSRQNRNRKRKATLKLVKRMIARDQQEQRPPQEDDREPQH
ncbi:MAG: hypothetical protein GFGODING_01849 [Flavobacteriales bacterium]|nr:hypothetical protein [Flavobacteriales bacterium]